MRNAGRSMIVLSVISLVPLCAARAQFGMFMGGFALTPNVLLPTGDMRDRWKIGFGGGIAGEHEIRGKVGIAGEFGYIRFLGRTRETALGDEVRERDLDTWEFLAGLRYRFAPSNVFAGLDGGYYVFSVNGRSGLDDQFGVLPVLGFRAENFGVTLRYKVNGTATWAEARLSLRGFR
jgi:hypothetical protein